ncbi:MAG: histidine kinase [Alphaproteobacteria bacterium]|jgi:two-component system chemotaxis sensor kinase CheA|nr:histidine kinase [Alphaproteobacteria bacterium]
MISKRLARLLRKHFDAADADAFIAGLLQQAEDIALPDNIRENIRRFPAFLAQVDDSYNELDERLKIAVRNLEMSSEELNNSNFALLRHNIATNAMMEGLGQGLLFFGPDGICSPVYSRACLTLLEGNPADRHISDILRLDERQRADFEPLIGLMFDVDSTALSFDELIALAPHFYKHSQGLQIALSYKPMQGATGALMGILLVATDITLKMEAQERLRQKEQQVLRTLRIAGNRASFVHALHVFQAVFEDMAQARDLQALRRDLHTVKGMANVFYLHDLAKMLHEIEDRVDALPQDGWQAGLRAIRAEFDVRLGLGIDYAHWLGREIWGMEFETGHDIISVSTAELARFGADLHAMLQSGGASPDAASRLFFERVASQSVWSLLSFFETQLSYFAEAVNRSIRIQHEKGDEVRLFPDFYRSFFDSLTHVARNIMDHAYEPAPLREILGKPPELQVRIRTSYTDSSRTQFQLVISDDGQGISFDKVTKRLREKREKIDGRTEADLMQHIFDTDFSTRDSVDMNAGRGIGMSAVKVAVQKLGGDLRVSSTEGVGTTLTIILPVLWQPQA